MKIVSDSSPLMALSVIGQLHLLHRKFDKISIPEAVWTEIAVDGRHKKDTENILRAKWIETTHVKNMLFAKSLETGIDYGESEAIALAMEMSADLILLDDKLARTAAANFELKIMGTVGILIWAKKAVLIELLQVELNNFLVQANFRLSQALINLALREVGEI